LGSFSLEMRYLSRETGEPRYAQFADRLYRVLTSADAAVTGDPAARAFIAVVGTASDEELRGIWMLLALWHMVP
jgi:hypothetical protein